MRGEIKTDPVKVPPQRLTPAETIGTPGAGALRHTENKQQPPRDMSPPVTTRASETPPISRRQGIAPSPNDFWGDDEPPTPRITRITQATLGENIADLLVVPAERGKSRAARLVGSALNRMAPPGFRENSKTEETKTDLGRMLKALLANRSVSTFMSSLPRANHPEFQAIAKEVLQNLKVEQLEALYAMLPDNSPQAQAIRDTADQLLAQVNPALSPSLQAQLCGAITSERAADAHSIYLHVRSRASELLPHRHLNADAACHRVVIEATALLLHREALGAESVTRFLLNLPARELTAILSSSKQIEQDVLGAKSFLDTASACATTRREQARKAFVGALTELESYPFDKNDGSFADPKQFLSFAAAVLHLEKRFIAYQSYALRPAGVPPQAGEQPDEQLEEALKPLSNVQNLRNLDPLQLKSLENALATLPVVEARGEIGRAMEESRKLDSEAHARLPQTVIEALQGVNHGVTVAHLLNTIRDTLEARARSRFPSKMDFRQELKQAVDALSLEKRWTLAMKMQAPQLRRLSAALRDLARTSEIKEHPALSEQLSELESVLDAVRTSANPVGAAPGNKAVAVIEELETLAGDDQIREALEGLGIEIGAGQSVNVISGIAGEHLQIKLKNSLLSTRTLRTVAPALVSEIARARFLVNGEPLADKEDLREHLNVLCADHPMLLEAVHNEGLANILQSAAIKAMTELMTTLAAPDTPIRDRDGSPIELLRGRRAIRFEFRRDEKLGLVVACKLEIENSKHGRAFGPQPRPEIHLRGNAEFTFEIAASPQNQATLSSPLQSRYKLLPPVFWAGRPYQEPQDYEEILQLDSEHPLAVAFCAFLDKENSFENWLFIKAVDGLSEYNDEQKAYERTQAIIGLYIKSGADWEVNIADSLKNQILAPLAPDDPPFETMRARLVMARQEILSLTSQDTLRRFRTHVASTAPQVASALPGPTPPNRAKPVQRRSDPSVGMAREAPAEQDKSGPPTNEFLAFQLRILFDQSSDARTLERAIKLLPPRNVNARKNSDEFRSHASAALRMLSPIEHAALLYSIDNVLDPAQREDPHIAIVRTAVIEARKGTREGRMTPESLLLEKRPTEMTREGVRRETWSIDDPTLHTWFSEGRVSEAEVASFLAQDPLLESRIRVLSTRDPAEYPAAKRLAMIGSRALEDKKQQLDRAQKLRDEHANQRNQLTLSIRNWIPEVSSSSSGANSRLTDGTVSQLTLVAQQFDRCRTLGDLLASAGSLNDQRNQLSARLEPLLKAFEQGKLAILEAQLNEIGSALAILGMPNRAVDDQLRLYELRHKEEQQALAAARRDEPPPPPPEEGSNWLLSRAQSPEASGHIV
jgi:hypothetical protein